MGVSVCMSSRSASAERRRLEEEAVEAAKAKAQAIREEAEAERRREMEEKQRLASLEANDPREVRLSMPCDPLRICLPHQPAAEPWMRKSKPDCWWCLCLCVGRPRSMWRWTWAGPVLPFRPRQEDAGAEEHRPGGRGGSRRG